MLKGFKEFALRGNVIDLAVAFVVGAAFAALVTSVSDNVIKPIVGLVLGGGVNVGTITIRDQVFDITALINATITFFITLVVIYFVVVAPMNKVREKFAKDEEAAATETELLAEIRDLLAERRQS